MIDLEIDLGDGLPPAKTEVITRQAKPSFTPMRFKAPEHIEITRTPVALVISVAPIRCLGCGAEHKDHRGIFVESRLSNGVRELQRTTLRTMGNNAALPRRVDISPEEAIPICYDCWLIESSFRDAAAVAAAEGGQVFGEPTAPTALFQLAHALQELHIGEEKE